MKIRIPIRIIETHKQYVIIELQNGEQFKLRKGEVFRFTLDSENVE